MSRSTRRWLEWAAVLGSVTLPAVAQASGGPFGLGVMLGDPTGLSAKLFLDPRHALDAALDFSFIDDAFYLHADYLLHLDTRRPSRRAGYTFLPYVGIGVRVAVHERDTDKRRDKDRAGRLAVRVPLGVSVVPPSTPIDVFVELPVVVGVVPEVDVDLNVAVGIRYYF